MPSVKKDKAAKAPSKSRKNTSQDASQEPQAPSAPKATIDDTIKVADSTIKADAPVKKSRKRVNATEDAAVTAGDAPVGKPSKKRKTAATKSEKVSGTAAPADVHAEVEYEGHVIAAKKKGKDKGVANSEETSTAGRKVAKGKAAKATKNEEKDVAVAEGVSFPKEKPAAKKSAPKKSKASDMPSIEEGAMNLLEAAKDTAATAFKKGEAAIMGQAAAENKAKGKKRKAAEDAAPSDTVEVAEAAPVASKKKQKKGKSATEKVVESISDRVTTFLNTIGEAVGGKSIADDVVGVAEDAVETKAQEKEKVKGKTTGTKGKERANAAMTEDRAEDTTAVAIVSVEEEDEWEPDDQTANLIRGFESDGEDDKDSGDEGFKEGKPVPKLPRRKGLSETLKDARSTNEPGVIYVGRIPHGFHEHQMRAYFTQFGPLNHVRLSRSKKTGRSKHYAFLEFASSEVAKIAADTMNNYLLFGHILKCSVVPKEQVHPNLWAGADKRFKAVPWARIEGRKLELPQGVTVWDKRVENERKRRKLKAEKVKEIMGYDVNMPALLGTESVPIKERNVKDKKLEAPKEAEAVKGEEVEGKFVVVTEDAKDGVITVSEEVTTKKSKDKDKEAAGKKEDKASKKKEKKEKKAVEEGEKTAGKMEDKASRKKEKKAVEGEKTAEKAEEQQKVSGKQEAKASKPKKEKKESKAPKPKKDKKAVRAASGAVETPKPANEAKETTTDGPSSKRTPKPSKRALEAQESEASSARKPKKAKS